MRGGNQPFILSRRAFCGAAIVAGGLLAGRVSDAASPALREFPDDLFGIAAFDAGHLVAVGYHGTVKVSSDAGGTWTRIDFGSPELLRRVAALDGGTAFTVGHQGSIFGSADYGRSWTSLFSEPGLYLRALAFTSPAAGWAVGHEGTILRTVDGGANWRRQKIADYKGRDLPRLSGIAAFGPDHAIVVGEFGVVAETVDGGANWRLLSYRQCPTLTDIAVARGEGLAVGLNGTLLRLVPGSVTSVDTGMTRHLLAASIAPDGRTLVAGQGAIFDWKAGGLKPAAVSGGFDMAHSWIGGVLGLPGGAAIGVGEHGAILRAAGADAPFVLAGTTTVTASANSHEEAAP
ncbi:hypothetical protein D3874_04525 [Oleomonas cavernae]|uniref:Photosynthesis system II assembly factor Ycf48/Hcf136-like domain-containing protein n=1 Tax=Oleomonas cavernae TaxID=2320859 RepID=A0A418W8N9_9PROT|nr:YCF48-related protein [Oleomonas cavernae]RJF86380.1 hypothetical protein D3874_04525 [Oleomonas cavernae]